MSQQPIEAGDYVIYVNGDQYELGLVKRVTEDGSGAFVYYHGGDTAAKTPGDHLHPLLNSHNIVATTLGGCQRRLDLFPIQGLGELGNAHIEFAVLDYAIDTCSIIVPVDDGQADRAYDIGLTILTRVVKGGQS